MPYQKLTASIGMKERPGTPKPYAEGLDVAGALGFTTDQRQLLFPVSDNYNSRFVDAVGTGN